MSLEEVDIRADLLTRPYRAPNYEGETRALALLARELAANPRSMLQRLVETALELCQADTAGISILEGDVFRWEALAGVFAGYRDNTMPRHASPCGVCIDENVAQLMHLPDRCFPVLLTEPRFVEALLIPFHAHGKPIGTVWIVTHNFERKFDREDERIVSMLSQFASAGWQLWKAYETAAESSARKSEFLAELGHELRNPLGAILSASHIIQTPGTAEPILMHAGEIVSRQTQHLARLVDDLLDVSRISRGKATLHPASVELQTIVAHALETTSASVERHGHRLSLEVPSAPIWLEADPVRLAQLLSNLLDNAAKHTPDGGEIWLEAEPGDTEVKISVRDTGVGILEGQLQGIFEMFTQGSGGQEDTAGGLGLGLMLVRSIAEMHGGTAEAKSEGPGKGSQFIVRLPTVQGPGVAVKRSERADANVFRQIP